MRTAVKRWGNSAAVRIPAAVLAEADMEVDTSVEMRAEKGRIVLEATAPRFQLDSLVKAIRPHQLHREILSGPPQGGEVW